MILLKSVSKKYQKRGFALIATISVMALLSILAIGMMSLSSIETRTSSSDLAQLEAQANARLALQIAIGRLQTSLGPDARATANASILDSDPLTAKIDGIAHPHWLGSYPTINPDNLDQNLLEPKDFRDWSLSQMEWLVSENSSEPIDPKIEFSQDSVTLAQYITDASLVVPSNTGIDSLDSGLLTNAKAGLVSINGGSGNLAWLVIDESMKARIDTVASFDGSDILDGSVIDADAQQISNYQIAQGMNLSKNIPNYKNDANALSKIITHNQLIPLGVVTGSSWEQWSKLNHDKFTPHSVSLPVDVMNGRLKKDLTAYFKGSSTELDSESMIDSRFNINTLSRTPRFEILKQWATMVANPTTPQNVIASKPTSPNAQHGIHPVITQGAVALQHSYKILSSKTIHPAYLIMPQIQLWNPHNVPLEAQDYIVQIGFQFKWDMRLDGTKNSNKFSFPGITNPGFHSWKENHNQPALPQHVLADNEDIEYQGNKRFFTFVIKNQAFKPGESLLFHAKPPSSGDPLGLPYNMNADADTDIMNNYQADEDLNLLVNEGSIDEFFYIETPIVGTLDPNETASINNSIFTESNFSSTITGSGAENNSDNDMHLNLYTLQDDKPTLLHAIKKAQNNTRTGNWKRTTYPLVEYQTGRKSASETYDFKSPLINFGSSMLASNFDLFNGGGNANLPPFAGQPHSALGYWNIRSKESFSASDDWAAGSIEATSWLNTFSFRETTTFLNTWQSTDNLYGNLSTDRLGGWHQSQVPGMVYPLFDYSSNEHGPLSLGSFQHANLSVYSWQPTYAFGNAQAPPRLSNRADIKPTTYADLYDVSYLLNASTWDSYYLSTIPQSGETLKKGTRLPNSRQYLSDVTAEGDLDADKLTNVNGYELSASSVLIHGGFNVNSTSETAWEALLSGTMGESIDTLNSSSPSNSDTTAPMGRFLNPLISEESLVGENRDNTDFATANAWGATRTLNAEEVTVLSKRIIEEVKRRGPFLSLADFVNRRLEPDTEVTGDERVYQEVLGSLQSAINKATVKDQQINNHYYEAENTAGVKMTIKPVEDWVSRGFNVSSKAKEAMFGATESTIDNIGGLIHNYAPNSLSQADILTKIGSSIAVRGDTFIIRAYGDSVDSTTGDIKAKAWCEAVVQRSAKPVSWDGTSKELVQPSSIFGREFTLTSFRWLSEKDVTPYTDDNAISNQ